MSHILAKQNAMCRHYPEVDTKLKAKGKRWEQSVRKFSPVGHIFFKNHRRMSQGLIGH